MTDYNGYGSSTPGSLTWQNDSGAYTFGQRFRVDTSGLSATKVRWFIASGSPAAPTSGYYVALYEIGNTTPVATAGPVTATVGAWNEAAISPVALTAGADYMAAVLFPGGYYGAQGGALPLDPAGPLNFYTSGYYNSGSSLTYPNSSSGTFPWYGVDVTVSDGAASGNDGSGTTGSGATTAAGTGTISNDGSGTAASEATTASGGGTAPLAGSGTAASGATTSTGTGTGPLGGFATARAELLDQLATVPGLVPLPYPSGTPAQGQAWPLLGQLQFEPYGVATWRVVVVAGGDGRSAEAWLDANLTAVLDALRPFMFVDSATPVDLGSNLLGVEFAGRKEIR